MDTNWHSETQERFSNFTVDQLIYTREDAYNAARVGDGWNPKAGQYWDEVHYCSMELKKRERSINHELR